MREGCGVVFKPYKNKIDDEDFDYHLPMGSLPRLFRSDIKDFENTATGYLKADKERVGRCGKSWV